jgi:hypothetical protein
LACPREVSLKKIREDFRKPMYLCGTILNVLADHLVDVVLHIRDAKALWDHLNARNELYIMENFS